MIQFKRGKTDSWERSTTPLADGQPGYDRDKNMLKIGDGKSNWAALPYLAAGADYVVEYNAGTDYFVRKWNSGFIECWGNGEIPDFIDELFENKIFSNKIEDYFEVKGFYSTETSK